MGNPIRPDRIMSAREAAEYVGCHPETIRRAVRRKELRAKRNPVARGQGFLIRLVDLQAFIEKRSAV